MNGRVDKEFCYTNLKELRDIPSYEQAKLSVQRKFYKYVVKIKLSLDKIEEFRKTIGQAFELKHLHGDKWINVICNAGNNPNEFFHFYITNSLQPRLVQYEIVQLCRAAMVVRNHTSHLDKNLLKLQSKFEREMEEFLSICYYEELNRQA
jgi:hypothetical protein